MKQLTINDVTYYKCEGQFVTWDCPTTFGYMRPTSRHVVMTCPNKKAIRLGAALCKQNTLKLANLKNVEFVYTSVDGRVIITNEKTLIV